jgi:hypothetical protein
VYRAAGVVVATSISILLSLLVFQQSMKQCRIRPGQVVRAWAYTAATFIVWGMLFYACCAAPISLYFGWTPTASVVLGTMQVATWPLAFVVGGRGLAIAYRHYLRMPHATGVAAAVVTITVLVTLVAALPLGFIR